MICIDGVVRVIKLMILLLKVGKIVKRFNIKEDRYSISIVDYAPLICFQEVELVEKVNHYWIVLSVMELIKVQIIEISK